MKTLVPVLLFLLALTAPIPGLTATGESQEGKPGTWAGFKARFVQPDGRVIDPWQNNITHSEGQGYGMLLALDADDRKGFEQIWKWTREHLQVRRTDHLLAWSWGRHPAGLKAPLDYNDAADGDMAVAWALLWARQKWNRPVWEDQARLLIADLRRFLVIERYGHTVLLPGYTGFVREDALVINPSYWILPALTAFARVDDPVLWNRVAAGARRLMRTAALGPRRLPPDWLVVRPNGTIGPDRERPPLFGYEAIRVFLWAALDGSVSRLPGTASLVAAMVSGDMAATVNLQTGKPGPNRAPAGFLAVAARCAEKLGQSEQAALLWKMAGERITAEEDDYYSQALYLLARLRLQ